LRPSPPLALKSTVELGNDEKIVIIAVKPGDTSIVPADTPDVVRKLI
jgi:hypothetical protein